MREFDTIAAVATAIGEGGISIIRISGDKALDIISKVFKPKNDIDIKNMKSYTMKYGYIKTIETNELIDEVIISYMKGPRSFTAEDTIEINCHGGVISTNNVLNEVVKAGARIAEPGEFTKRAFLNGRIDLSQAEAVIDIIKAKTELSMKSAMAQSQGKLSQEINTLSERVLNVLATIEHAVDFTEDDEDIDPSVYVNVEKALESILDEINMLLKHAEEGKILRDGLKVVIVGKPNVGKSSLMNALLKEKRAIVTDIPGTTRDVIEEYINLDGIPIKVTDTAGIRETNDLVEKIGVEKSKEKINESDLIIFMIDRSRKLDDEDKEIIHYIKGKKHIVLLNKMDLEANVNEEEINELENIISISAKEEIGLDKLKENIKNLFFSGKIDNESLIISNGRHKEALYRARENCEAALNSVKANEFLDLVSIYVVSGMKALGEITGAEVEEDLVNKIFSDFCVGK